jgi:hypothetical protein
MFLEFSQFAKGLHRRGAGHEKKSVHASRTSARTVWRNRQFKHLAVRPFDTLRALSLVEGRTAIFLTTAEFGEFFIKHALLRVRSLILLLLQIFIEEIILCDTDFKSLLE